MITQEKKKWIYQQLIPFILVFGGLLAGIIFGLWRQHQISIYKRYTIGITIKTYWTISNGKRVDFRYTVKNNAYENEDMYGYECKVPNGRYFVKYDTKDPSISKLIQNEPVPDSIKVSPPDGWKEIPVKYDDQ